MSRTSKRILSIVLSICMVISGITITRTTEGADTLINVVNGKSDYTFLTSNANTPVEGFLYVGNGFSAVNCTNETLTNGNNLLGKTATTDEVAIYVDLKANYDISYAKVYQGSTNGSFPDSYSKNFSVYYSTEAVSTANQGKIQWDLAGTCDNGTIYSGAVRNSAADVSSTGDRVDFNDTYKARSVKIVFDKNSCMGTGNIAGTVSVLSFQVYGTASINTGDEPDDGVVDVLFIGNSFMYYNTSWNVFKGLAEYNGHNVKVTAATNGGQDLTYQATAGNVLDAIRVGGYDVVVLQDKVGSSFKRNTLMEGSATIIPIIKQYSPNARFVYYEPWPTRGNLKNQINDFTYGYIEAAQTYGAALAPAGEGFYDLFYNNGLEYYCSDDRHPQPLGTFNSASTIYYAMFPEDSYRVYTESDHAYLNNLINTNVAYTNEGQQSSYSLDTLNLITSYAYKYAHAVIPAVNGTGTYTSVKDGGKVEDPIPEETQPPTEPQPQTTGEPVTGQENLTNVVLGREKYTYLTSNANTPVEGFLYIGNGFSTIQICNDNPGNANNLLGKTATTNEVAAYVDLGANYDISNAKVYQGSSNNAFPDSYCKNFSIYYSTEQVSVENQGNVTWNLAGTCNNGTIYSGAVRNSAADVSSTGDVVNFSGTYTARSVKIVFDKDSCMGTGNIAGTVSLSSFQVYGKKSGSEEVTQPATTTPSEPSTPSVDDPDATDVLFIGNSMTYYNTLCNVVQGIATRKGKTINCTAATNGGQNLIYQSTASNVLTAIKKGGYEVVVLQDIVGGFDDTKLQTGADAIIPIIKQYNPSAQIIFYEPWPTKDTISGERSLLPYFTNSYIKTAKSKGAKLAPAGEAFYELYTDYNLDFYCADQKHPQPLGTFTSASTIYHTLYPDEAYEAFTAADQTYLDNLINTNVAYTDEGKQNTYSLDTLNLIFSLGHKYAQAVIPAVNGIGKYTSVAGVYTDLDEEANPDGLSPVQGQTVDASAFTKVNGNLAVGCNAYASSGNAANGVNGNTGDRWESTHGVDPQWFYVDLGSAKDFNTVGFIWEGAYASKYYIQISDDADSWKTIAYVTATKNETVQISLGQTYNARYIRMYGTKRGTGYGYSFYEMGVWNLGVDTEETTPDAGGDNPGEETSKPVEETTTEMPSQEQATTKKTNVQMEINGCQISTSYKGFRVVYSVSDQESEVDSVGLVYGLEGYANDADMTVNSSNSTVYSYEATQEGKLITKYSDLASAQSYAMTMRFIKSKKFYTTQIKVRGYAKLKNGEYIYTDVKSFVIYDVADYLYQRQLMSNLVAHNYLYDNILKFTNASYERVEYNLGNTLAKF